jgi:hypothetical protein
MRRLHSAEESPMQNTAWASLIVFTLACQGRIAEPGGEGPRGPTGGTTPTKSDNDMRRENPSLFMIAAKYFPGDTETGSPKRLFRLTAQQLDITTKSLLPAHYTTSALATLPQDPLQTNYEYSANLGFTAANFTPYIKWVDAIAASVRAKPESVIGCAGSANSPACLAAEARKLVARAFRGTASAGQLARYADFFTASVAQVGFADATADLVHLTLTSPSYVFREEVQTDAGNFLAPAQRLQNITYTLADAPPEAVKLSSVTPAAHLQTPEALQRTIETVMASPEARAKLRRFINAWLEIKDVDEFTISTAVFPEFTPAVAAAAIAETNAFLDFQLSRATPRLPDITQSTQTFLTAPAASLYQIRNPPAGAVDLDPLQRLGVFTQPAVIASHSGPTTTRLVKRGVFFTRKVLCLPLGAPPPGIDTTVPENGGVTERERIESATTPARCAGCHAVINPFGFMQENYDAIGRWRTTDAGQPIDASISLGLLDEGPLNAKTPVEALKGLTSSALFKQCFVRQLYRFYLGRDESTGDDPLLRRLFFGFANNDDQALVGLLQAAAVAPSFSQRSEAR